MKQSKIFIGLIILSIGLFTSCDHDTIRASGEVTSLEYSIPDYSELKISNAFNAYVTFSDTEESIRIEANDNLHDKIIVNQEGNALVIRLKKFTSVRGNATLNAYIVTKNISTFDISGASRLTLENEWVESDARIDLSGASDFTGEVVAERLYLDMAGASSLDLFGKATFLNAKLSGSSNVRDYDLEVEDLKIELSGASDAFLSVNRTIDVSASGASVLNYKGNATINNKKLSGSSEVKNQN
ncbi:head GIN domain-containing protein [Maribacter halichondriae]|uniref:head GIN domain-containing protein n=1 Tax=Maribacter halichondriae TaxID=2980554 RepID=UPI0023595005|nr:head GIN domain-containing protein [Maribacter sp. Hal144]